MNELRRLLLKGGGAGGALALALAAGLLRPSQALASERNASAFEAKTLADALGRIGASDAAANADIIIKAPDMAENGMVIPVEVSTSIAGAASIALLAEKNTFPLISYVDISGGTEGYVNTRIKLAQTTAIKAVVKAGGKNYVASREIKVAIGGCGG